MRARSRTKAALVAGTVVLAGAGMAVVAPAADASPGKVCMTHQQFFDALTPYTQRHLYRKGRLSYGISDVRCAHGWAVAGAEGEKHGKEADGFVVNERRNSSGAWHQIDRAKPCREHKVPKKIFIEFCESD